MRRAIVVGGGVVGLSCAIRLAERDWSVTMFDQAGARPAASWGNAGHIAVEQTAPLASRATLRSMPGRRFAAGGAVDLPIRAVRHWLPFGMRLAKASAPARFAGGKAALAALLADAMPAWQRLTTAIGDPSLVRAQGHLVVWESPRTAVAGRAAWHAADIGTARVHDANADDRAAIAAIASSPIAGAVRFDGSGQIDDLDRLADRLARRLRELGGTIVRQHAALDRAHGRTRVGGQDADLVVVAAGIESRPLMAAIGHRVPLIAERGYHIRAPADRWPADTPPIVFEDRSLIVTRFAGCVQAASFVEFNAPDAPADPRKWERLEAHVAALGLPMTAPFERWMGARPTLPDYLPAIGRSRRSHNLVYAFGHQHLGLTLAPVTAEIVATLADGDDPRAAPFAIDRFA